MTNRYVASGGNAGTWTGTVTTLTAGLTAAVAGDDIYIASDHAEPVAGSAITYTALGTVSAPNRIFVAPTSSSFPPVAADLVHVPTVTLSSNIAAANITTAGVVSHCEGIIWSSGTAALQANVHFGGNWNLENCAVVLANSAANSAVRVTATGTARIVWNNVTVQFGATGQGLQAQGGEFLWKNTPSALLGVMPTSLFTVAGFGVVLLRGVDLSALSSKNLIAPSLSSALYMTMVGCKEPAAWTRMGAQAADFVTLVGERCENGAVHYSKYKEDIFGTQTTETTIVRTGGASDGVTPNSWKIDTQTKAKTRLDKPFRSTPIVIWNDVSGVARTVTVYGAWTALPTNADIWLEVDYLGSSASPLLSMASTKVATPISTPASVATDASAWASSPGTAFKLVATMTPAVKGPFTIRVCVGAQGVFYVDWQPVIA